MESGTDDTGVVVAGAGVVGTVARVVEAIAGAAMVETVAGAVTATVAGAGALAAFSFSLALSGPPGSAHAF